MSTESPLALEELINYISDNILGLDGESAIAKTDFSIIFDEETKSRVLSVSIELGSLATGVVKTISKLIDLETSFDIELLDLSAEIQNAVRGIGVEIADFARDQLDAEDRLLSTLLDTLIADVAQSALLSDLATVFEDAIVDLEFPEKAGIVNAFEGAFGSVKDGLFPDAAATVANFYTSLGVTAVANAIRNNGSISNDFANVIASVGNGFLVDEIDTLVKSIFTDETYSLNTEGFISALKASVFDDLLLDDIRDEFFDDFLGLDGGSTFEVELESILTDATRTFFFNAADEALDFITGDVSSFNFDGLFEGIDVVSIVTNIIGAATVDDFVDLFVDIKGLGEQLASELGGLLATSILGDTFGTLALDALASQLGSFATSALGVTLFQGLGSLFTAGVGAIAGSLIYEGLDWVTGGWLSDIIDAIFGGGGSPQVWYDVFFDDGALTVKQEHVKDSEASQRDAIRGIATAYSDQTKAIIDFVDVDIETYTAPNKLDISWRDKSYGDRVWIGDEYNPYFLSSDGRQVAMVATSYTLEHLTFDQSTMRGKVFEIWKSDMLEQANNAKNALARGESLADLQKYMARADFAENYIADPTIVDEILQGEPSVAQAAVMLDYAWAVEKGLFEGADLGGVDVSTTALKALPATWSVSEDNALQTVLFAEGKNIVFSVAEGGEPQHGSATITPNGGLIYTPDLNFNGVDEVRFVVRGADGSTSEALVKIIVEPVEDAPITALDHLIADEHSQVVGNVFDDNGSGKDFDPEGDDFKLISVDGISIVPGSQITLESGALLTINSDGQFEYEHNNWFGDLYSGESRTDVFRYGVEDENGNVSFGSVLVTTNGIGGFEQIYTFERGGIVSGELSERKLEFAGIDDRNFIVATPFGYLFINSDGHYEFEPSYGAFDHLAPGESFTHRVTLADLDFDLVVIGTDAPPINHIDGSKRSELLTGTADWDFVEGFSGDDVLEGLAGDDVLIGGSGSDTAIFYGSLKDFEIEQSWYAGFDWVVSDLRNGNPEGTDRVASVEFFKFIQEDLDDTDPQIEQKYVIITPEGLTVETATLLDSGKLSTDRYIDGVISENTVVFANGNIRTTRYDETGQRTVQTFEDVVDRYTWSQWTERYDQDDDLTFRKFTFDDGTVERTYFDGGVEYRQVTVKSNGDKRTIFFDGSGNISLERFEDVSDTRPWETYEKEFAPNGSLTVVFYEYGGGITDTTHWLNGLVSERIVTESDKDYHVTTYNLRGIKASFTFVDGSQSRVWESYTQEFAPNGALTALTYDYGGGISDTIRWLYGSVVDRTITEADGDRRITAFNPDGTTASFTFEDGSGVRLWESFTQDFAANGALSALTYDYGSGIVDQTRWVDGVLSDRTITEADGDRRITTYGEHGKKTSFTFEDVSDVRAWDSYTQEFASDGHLTALIYDYGQGVSDTTRWENGVKTERQIVEADGDIQTTTFFSNGYA